nr:integrase arm-type DNA-binding domain-containing protein [Nitrosophilus labii]
MCRIATPLSDRKIKISKPKDKIYRLSDSNGLLLEIKPNDSKIWRVRYTLISPS